MRDIKDGCATSRTDARHQGRTRDIKDGRATSSDGHATSVADLRRPRRMWEGWWADMRRVGGRGAPNSLRSTRRLLTPDPNLAIERCGQECPGVDTVSGDRDEPGPRANGGAEFKPGHRPSECDDHGAAGACAEVEPPTTAAPIARSTARRLPVDRYCRRDGVAFAIESGEVAVPCRVDRFDVGEARPSSCRVTSHPGGP